jgi:hypothetical protein
VEALNFEMQLIRSYRRLEGAEAHVGNFHVANVHIEGVLVQTDVRYVQLFDETKCHW